MINSNLVEYTLVGAALIFLFYAWYTLRESKKDADANARLKVNGARKIMSGVGVDVGWINVICAGLVLMGGLGALAFPPPPPNYSEMPQSLLLITILILICLMLSLESQIMKTARRRIDAETPQSHQGTLSVSASPDDVSHAAPHAVIPLDGDRRRPVLTESGSVIGAEETARAAQEFADAQGGAADAAKTVARVARVVADVTKDH